MLQLLPPCGNDVFDDEVFVCWSGDKALRRVVCRVCVCVGEEPGLGARPLDQFLRGTASFTAVPTYDSSLPKVVMFAMTRGY